MTPVLVDRLRMLREGCRHHDFLGWTRESCEWFEMNGMVRRLYMGDGLAVNAHEDEFLGSGLDSVSVSGRGVSMILDVSDADLGFFYWGFEVVGCFRSFRLCFHPSDTGSEPSSPPDITDSGVWDASEAERLLSLSCSGGGAPATDDPRIRLSDGLTVTVNGSMLGSLRSPQAEVSYRRGAVSVEICGTLTRCREGVAVVDGHGSFVVIALPTEGIGGPVSRGLGATLRYLNSNPDGCCEGPWSEARLVPTDRGTGGEVLSFPFPEGLRNDPGWRDVNACLGVDGSCDCDLFWAGSMHDEGYLGSKPGPLWISFVFKPTGFRIHDWSHLSEPTMSQPLTEGELRHLMRLCRRHMAEHPQGGAASEDDD